MAWALKGVEAWNLFRKRPKGFIFCDTEPTWKFKEVESSRLQWSSNFSQKINGQKANCAYRS